MKVITYFLHAEYVFAWVFVCLLGIYSLIRKNFNSYGDVTITGKGLQILTYTRHSWHLNTYCDTGHLLIIFISKEP